MRRRRLICQRQIGCWKWWNSTRSYSLSPRYKVNLVIVVVVSTSCLCNLQGTIKPNFQSNGRFQQSDLWPFPPLWPITCFIIPEQPISLPTSYTSLISRYPSLWICRNYSSCGLPCVLRMCPIMWSEAVSSFKMKNHEYLCPRLSIVKFKLKTYRPTSFSNWRSDMKIEAALESSSRSFFTSPPMITCTKIG